MKKRKTVLLVDDFHPFLEIMRAFLLREEVEVLLAQSGTEALAIARAARPDLIVLDLHMGDLDGDVCCRHLKQSADLHAIPVLLVASGEMPEEYERCQRAGCDAVIAKPLTRDNFLVEVRRFLRLRERPSPRIKTRLLVRCGIDRQNVLTHYTVNLSAGGLFLETPILLPIESLVGLEFYLPDAERPVVCKGRIAWVNAAGSRAKNDFPPGLGVQFLHLQNHDVSRLQEFVRSECLDYHPFS